VEAWNAGVVICARPRLAHFPFVKTFEQFDFGFQPALDERQIRELRSLRSSSDTLRSRSLPRLRYCRRAAAQKISPSWYSASRPRRSNCSVLVCWLAGAKVIVRCVAR
jgi:IstB-like ATP binding protein